MSLSARFLQLLALMLAVALDGCGVVFLGSETTSGSTGSVSSGAGSAGGASTSASSSSGSSGSTGSVTGSTTGSATSSTSGGTSGQPAGFAGEWDTDWAHVSLTGDGGLLTGTYYQWGWFDYSYDSGWITGSFDGSVFTGLYDDWMDSNFDAGAGGNPIQWTLTDAGSFFGTGNQGVLWCGARTGGPLPTGCGWTGGFDTSNWGRAELVQTGVEVHGTVGAGDAGIAGTAYPRFPGAAGLAFDGVVHGAGGPVSRISWSLEEAPVRQFTGNELVLGSSAPIASCGVDADAGLAVPSSCFGGGGPQDGLWFTNRGTLLVAEPIATTAPVCTAVREPELGGLG